MQNLCGFVCAAGALHLAKLLMHYSFKLFYYYDIFECWNFIKKNQNMKYNFFIVFILLLITLIYSHSNYSMHNRLNFVFYFSPFLLFFVMDLYLIYRISNREKLHCSQWKISTRNKFQQYFSDNLMKVFWVIGAVTVLIYPLFRTILWIWRWSVL